MISNVTRLVRLFPVLLFLIFASFLQDPVASQAQTTAPTADSLLPGPKPPDVSTNWKYLVGTYGHGKENVIILERDRGLFWLVSANPELLSAQISEAPIETEPLGSFVLMRSGLSDIPISLHKESNANVTAITLGGDTFTRHDAGSDPTHFYHVSPARPVSMLRAKALKLLPPAEPGPFRKPDLVELAILDPAIRLDVRYASGNNFLSTPVYTQARAFMQRPAAEALLRVLHKLQPLGYGLLIHDAYRPWYVTKIFWDATPPEGKIFVANPREGSKHNRGCAVDLTLYDLATGQAIEMPGLYDEMSQRSFPNFPGGTSLQRWHRDLLRRAMESEGFTVNEDEWWHFDYKEWKQYGILNVPFEKIAGSQQPEAISH
jgi:D-alanyl-D-alanine dipeptidase